MSTTTSKAVLNFNNNQYDLASAINQAASGPNITINSDELDLVSKEAQAIQVIQPSNGPDIKSNTVVLYKYNGKYLVLVGRDYIETLLPLSKTIKGHLISTPALKRTRIPTAAELARSEAAEEEQAQASRFRGFDSFRQQGRPNYASRRG